MTDPVSTPLFAPGSAAPQGETMSRLLARLQAEQRAGWQRGERGLVETLLQENPALRSEAEAILELIYHEVLLREEHGEAPRLDEYLQRFPQFAAQLRDQFEVHGALESGRLFRATPSVGPDPAAPPDVPPPATARPTPTGYEILGELGRGGMGIVYKARQGPLNRLVALKMIRDQELATDDDVARFAVEAEAAARLQHPNIVQVYEVGEWSGHPYLALELVEGDNLAHRLDGTPQPARPAAELAETLARAVHAAHTKGIIHRDLKPANVLLAADGTPKVTDFGLAKRLEAGGPTVSGAVMGTPEYMAPEQAQGRNREIGPAADIYALGAILYEVLTGRPPFKGETVLDTMRQVTSAEPVPPQRLQPGVPRDLETICLKCLEKEPARRYATAAELADDLQRFAQGKTIRARPVGMIGRGVKWAKRRPLVAALLALVLLVAAVGFGSTLAQWHQAEAAKDEAQRALAQAETHLYSACIALAQREWEGGDIRRMLTLLDRCPPSLRHWEWRYLKGLCHTDLLTLDGHVDGVSAVAASPDGQRLASASLDGTVKLWDAATGKELHTLRAGAGCASSVAFSPDGQYLASGHEDGTVKLWDATAGREVRTLHGHRQRVLGVTFRGDGRHCASASADRSVKVWEVASGQEIRVLQGHGKEVTGVAYSPTGRQLASSSLDHTTKVWDAASGREVWTLRGHGDEVRCVAFSPDGRYLVSAGEAQELKVWDLATGKEVRTLDGHRDGICSVAFSPDGRLLASASRDRTIIIWDFLSNRPSPVLVRLKGHLSEVNHSTFSPDGKRLVSASLDRTVKVWDATQYHQKVLVLSGHADPVWRVAFSPDSQYLASASGDLYNPFKAGEVKIWDVHSRQEVRTLRGHKGGIGTLAYAPDGRRLASGSGDGTVKIWEAAGGGEVLTLRGHAGTVFDVTFSPDGRWLASGSGTLFLPTKPGEVKIWDADTGTCTLTLRGHQGLVSSVAFSPDGRRLASGSGDRTIKIWDPATGQETLTLRGHMRSVFGVAFSPDGQRLASCSGDWLRPNEPGEVKLWDAATGTEILSLKGHFQMVLAVAYSPDGQRLASASRDGRVKLWDPRSGEEILSLQGNSVHMLSVAFSPDGQRLAAGNWNKSVNIWEARLPRPSAAPIP